jgi:hypothetical protein
VGVLVGLFHVGGKSTQVSENWPVFIGCANHFVASSIFIARSGELAKDEYFGFSLRTYIWDLGNSNQTTFYGRISESDNSDFSFHIFAHTYCFV